MPTTKKARQRQSSVWWGLAGVLCPVLAASAVPATSPLNTETADPTAVVAAKCVPCHGPKEPSAGLDLSRRAGAVSAGERIVDKVRSGLMPPGGRLPSREVDALARWAKAGFRYPAEPLAPPSAPPPDNWSLRPLAKVQPPKTPFESISTHPVDRFVFAKLQEKGLTPSPVADRRTLLRRASLTLTGLPPTAAEFDAFRTDTKPGAWERAVDRLLESPAYGERMARLWLDVVRFGESHGYEQNHLRENAWPYRDWVIRAFERDLPWGRFVSLQLAADQMAPEDSVDAAATGFLVAGIHDTVGIQEEQGTRQQRSNDLDDMVSTTAQAFLGITVGCARCHDHKFDPVPQTDYYRLAAVFAGVRHGERTIPARKLTVDEQREKETLAQQLRTSRNRLQEIDAIARTAVLTAKAGGKPTRPAVNSRRNTDDFPETDARFVRFTILATNDGHEPCIDELQVFGADMERNLALASRGAKATASGELPGFAIHRIPGLNDGILGNEHSWIPDTKGSGWAKIELARVEKVRRVVFSRDAGDVPRFDDRLPVRYRIEVSLDGNSWKLVATDEGRAGTSDYIHPDELKAALPSELRSERERLDNTIRRDNARLATLEAGANAYIGRFSDPDPIRLLRRGDVMQPQQEIRPGALGCVSGLPTDFGDVPEGGRRERLARWIADPRNPLTWRVAVNRVWQQDFGVGIVDTASDFGKNGGKPSHPELLDWLAGWFARSGGSVKALHRLLLTSHAWKQSAAARPEGMRKDAGNRLLWRHPLRRMEAEMIRDSMLLSSGKLDRRRFGPGYRLYDYRTVNIAIYEPKPKGGPDTWRRGIYHQNARAVRDSLLGAFDCPESSVRTARRDSTTTALQALALWNGEFTIEQAGFVAETAKRSKDPVAAAFQAILGRLPDPGERRQASAVTAKLGVESLCRALFNSNEFLYY